MKIAIMGAGSLGTIIGGFIAKGGEDVVLIDVNKAHVDAMNEKGATIIGTTEQTLPVNAILPTEMEGTYDLVLLLTKQYFNEDVLTNLLPFLHSESIVCSLQNGVPEESIASIVGKERVVAGSVEFGATYISPGVSELTSVYKDFKEFAFMIGELTGATTARLNSVKSVLDHVGETKMVDNLMGTKWSKLLINASMSGLSAGLNCTYGDVLADEKTLEYAVRLIDETVRVGHENGIRFVPMVGLDFDSFLIDEDNLSDLMMAFKKAVTPHARIKASMLQDLEKGIETEINFINGVVVDSGEKSCIDTPFNSLVVTLVQEAEQVKHVPSFDENIVKVKQLVL